MTTADPRRQMLERPIHELCLQADVAYRKTSRRGEDAAARSRAGSDEPPLPIDQPQLVPPSGHNRSAAGLALRAAAMQAGEYPAWQRIAEALRRAAPDVAADLGLGG